MASMLWLLAIWTVFLPALFLTVSAFTHGRPASIADFPFVVGLYTWPPIIRTSGKPKSISITNPFCTGTIATDIWVLTSLGCLDREDNVLRGFPLMVKDIRVVAGTAFTPYNVTTFERYEYRTGVQLSARVKPGRGYNSDSQFKRPEKQAITDIFLQWNSSLYQDTAYERGFSNKEKWKDMNNNNVYRYYVDFALLKVDRPWNYSRFIQPAIFPEMSASSAFLWWNSIARTKLQPNGEYDIYAIQPCYAVGWGGRKDGRGGQIRLRYTKVSWVSDKNCELSYCNECTNCSQTPIRINPPTENCWAAHTHGDACLADEGSPLWCPWVGRRIKKRGGKYARTGAVIGVLGRVGGRDCHFKEVPSIYHNVWNSYHMFHKVLEGYSFPSETFIFDYPDYL